VRHSPRALIVAFLLAALPARAHVRLVAPISRYGDAMKAGPCGLAGGLRTTRVTTVPPGQQITVIFDEIIDHPGYFRIAFDQGGDGALAPPVYDPATSTWSNPPGVLVLADHIQDAVLTHGVVQVTLPDVECDTCTLQLIQVMTDKPPFDGLDDFYYQCADLVLSSTAPPYVPPPPGTTLPPPAVPMSPGGCDASGGPVGALGVLVALLALGAARRPRGRPPFRR
jgi:uncharacterized protein (TIGR03382 family)